MRAAIVGCGAIGGHLAVKLGQSGADVSVLARGQTLSAIRRNGVRLQNAEGGDWQVPVTASERSTELGAQDVVLVCVKTTALAEIASQLPALMHAGTKVVFVLNGLPWWYLLALRAQPEDWSPPLSATLAVLQRSVPLNQVLGGIANSANHVVEPGVIWNSNPSGGFVFGAPEGGACSVAEDLAQRVAHHSGKGMASADLRSEVWRKLYSNIITHTLGSLTGATSQDLMADPALQTINASIVGEMLQVARACGCTLPASAFAFVKGVAGHKSSMLQDFEQGRKPEIDSLLPPLVDLARMHQLPVPALTLLLALLRKKAAVQGIYP